MLVKCASVRHSSVPSLFVSLRLPVLLGFHSSAAAMSVLCVLQYFLHFLTYFDAAQFSVEKPM